ncbi:hypothetical protein Pmani_004700 [Petrolisthes manimaculis]|uniref:Uncharacterized protein n=1 Tax=Petrolisthes manimaculis TaxID=1843537 RepID=A0AAE1QE88_9EUCA|nr:hypothetical protein Pmani_004700 [Petrolisthes manimaculis]
MISWYDVGVAGKWTWPKSVYNNRDAPGIVRCRNVMTAADLTLCSLPPGQRSHCHNLATVPLPQMIVYDCLNRLTDDTPQSATTYIRSDADQLVHEGARCIKLLSKQLAKYYNQICLQAEDITIQVVEGS